LLKILPKGAISNWNPEELKDDIKGQYKELDIIYKQFAEGDKDLKYPHFWDQKQVNEWCERFFPYAKTIEHQIRALILLHKFWLGEKETDETLALIISALLPENYAPIRRKTKKLTQQQADIFKMTLIGYSQKEMAEYLGITQQAVSQHWYGADKKVRKLLKEFPVDLFPDLEPVDFEEEEEEIIYEYDSSKETFSNPNKPPDIHQEMTMEELKLKKQADELLKINKGE